MLRNTLIFISSAYCSQHRKNPLKYFNLMLRKGAHLNNLMQFIVIS